MSDDLSLFDAPVQREVMNVPPGEFARPVTRSEAAARRDDGMTRVEEHAPDGWKDEAWRFLIRYLETHEQMHVDELWDAGLPVPPELRALGPLFNRAARTGLMRKSGRFKPSVRSNLTEKPVWVSQVYQGQRAS